jgi:DNA replication ATP-dependent helicase Dna2
MHERLRRRGRVKVEYEEEKEKKELIVEEGEEDVEEERIMEKYRGVKAKGGKALEYVIEFKGVNGMNMGKLAMGGRDVREMEWRLETEGSSTYLFNIMRNNLYQLLMKREFVRQKNYIVLNHEPRYEDNETMQRYEKVFSSYIEDLNEQQKTAILRSLAAKDFQWILALPASGELLVIERIVKWASILKRKVLLMASSNSVVDATLLNIRNKQPELKWFRLNTDSKNPDVRLKDATRDGNNWGSMKELTDLVEETDIFWTTTMSMFHPFLLGLVQKFEYVIVQEASVLPEPIGIGPSLLGKTMIMFGDYYILNPSVKSIEADEKGLGISLFRRLWEQYLDKLVVMRQQYRMNRDILKMSNSIAYSGLMQHGSQVIKEAVISYPIDNKSSMPWIQEVKSPSRSVIFINIDNLLFKTMPGDISVMKTKNFYEAAVIKGLVWAFLESGIKTKDLAVVSPVQNHLFMLKKQLREQKVKWINTDRLVEISRDIVIVSTVKWSRHFYNLKEIRRLYLAFVRAKKKLIIVGSKNNLNGVDPLNKFIRYMDRKNWYIEINNIQQIYKFMPPEANRLLSKFSSSKKQDKLDLKLIVKEQPKDEAN